MRATQSTVASLFNAQVRYRPSALALQMPRGSLTYGELQARIQKLAGALRKRGVGRGSRLALLSENRGEFLEVVLAAAQLGAVVACQNWRLTSAELAGCIQLVQPTLGFASASHAELGMAAHAAELGGHLPWIQFGEAYESMLRGAEPCADSASLDPEELLLLLYTSGTTGRPKAAMISHRAEIIRNLVTRAEFGVAAQDSFVAWSPLYHMGALDNSLGTLMSGGKVIVVDGFDAEQLLPIVEREALGWLLLMPGMVSRFADRLQQAHVVPKGIRVCGVMADLVPRREIARITSLLRAPYANTFGATETGCPPCSSSLIDVGVVPERLSKQQSPFCEVKLVDQNDQEVPVGVPGELCLRGPTLFSGYFRASETNARDFRGGWFHMGDVFMRQPDGSLDFVDRVKYLIKSGGENIYPAEIENVLLTHPGVLEAVTVRRKDERWGEVPVAFVARRDSEVTESELVELCRARLARYKQPRAIEFLPLSEFPRSASGKVLRHELEKKQSSRPLSGDPHESASKIPNDQSGNGHG